MASSIYSTVPSKSAIIGWILQEAETSTDVEGEIVIKKIYLEETSIQGKDWKESSDNN